MTTTTGDPHTLATATDAFSDAWAAVHIDVAEKLEAEERQTQAGHPESTSPQTKGDSVCHVPSSEYFQTPNLDSFQIAFKRGHNVDAARTRGSAHGFEFVRQAWKELAKASGKESVIAKDIIRPWIETLVPWVGG
jgi:hypothetical protein